MSKIDYLNKPFLVVWALLAGWLFYYPLSYGRLADCQVAEWNAAAFTDLKVLGFLALGALFLAHLPWQKVAPKSEWHYGVLSNLALVILVASYQLFTGRIAPYTELKILGLVFSLLAAAAYHAEFKRALPYYALILWAVNLILYIEDLLGGYRPLGYCGNWNWSSTLLLTTSLFVTWPWRKFWQKLPKWQYYILLLSPFAASAVFLASLEENSRGTLLGAALAIIIGVGIWLYRRNRRVFAWTLGAVILLKIILIAVLGEMLWHAWRGEIRSELFAASLRALADDWPWCGFGFDRIGEVLATHKTLAYYQLPFASLWSPHTHNEVLQLLLGGGVGGIWAIAAAGILLGMLIVRCYRHFTYINLACAFTVVVILAHGMVDVTLEVWPLNGLFVLILGVFWGEMEPQWFKRQTPVSTGAAVSGRIGAILAVLAAAALLAVNLLAAQVRTVHQKLKVLADRGQMAASGPQLKRLIELSKYTDNPEVLYEASYLALAYLPQGELVAYVYLQLPELYPDYRFTRYFLALTYLKLSTGESQAAAAAEFRRKAGLLLLAHCQYYPDRNALAILADLNRQEPNAQVTDYIINRLAELDNAKISGAKPTPSPTSPKPAKKSENLLTNNR